jgi:type IV pilus assembly protein PilB
LRALEPSAIPKNLVNENLIRRHNAIPLYRRGNQIFIGLSDPTNLRALEDIKFQTGLNTEPVIVIEDQLTTAL